MSSSHKKGRGNTRQLPVSQQTRNVTPQPLQPDRVAAPIAIDEGIKVFLSYARADDAAFNMVRPFKELLSHLVYAKVGRQVRAFVDQDDIQWGDIWKERLTSEILGATVFIPLLSAAYLDSPNCRMEFNRFYSNARTLGVTELLLPVLVLKAPVVFHDDSPDQIVRVSAERQWENIEEAVLSDRGSSEWKRTMARLADRFVQSYQAAESRLATLSPDQLGGAMTDSETADEDEEDDESLGLFEIMELMNAGFATMTTAAEAMAPAIEALGNGARSVGALPPTASAKEIQLWSMRAAHAFGGPAKEVESAGQQMFTATAELDSAMQRLRYIVGSAPESTGLSKAYTDMVAPLSDLTEVRDQLIGLLDSMRPAELFSVPLRKSLVPARRGLTRVTDSIQLIQAWAA
ncbi:toll/interleukin-1 receptor domain-containing protein [Propionicimonas paludicola]|uniref:toll/interleukin-1 receptor domain-containing protein n=1 Tax=Propionicimonas paludicola TaxID=185243 RepID=UPI001473D5BC|nr:toll/interleukin-1 receptor domain-containing protein [Propionicimonas paludicola]